MLLANHHLWQLFKQQFSDTLLKFIRSSGVSAVIFMGGVDTSDRTDTQMLSVRKDIYTVLSIVSLRVLS